MPKLRLALATGFALVAGPLLAQSIVVEDAYARASTPSSPSGAAFMVLTNAGEEDDRLLAVRAEAAARVELHTHAEDANGVMRMREIEDGLPLPAGESHALARGGDHVMLMGLTAPLEQGATLPITLTFERAGDVEVEVIVDHERKATHAHGN